MAAPAAERAQQPTHGESQALTRRRIYLQRLVGDDVLAPKQASGPRMHLRVVLRFVAYLIVATVVIITRSDVGTVFQLNSGIEMALKNMPFYDQYGNERYFASIKTQKDMTDWLQEVVVNAVRGTPATSVYSRKLCLLGFNRVTPFEGTCLETASVVMTLRKAATTVDFKTTTTERFARLYPRTWLQGTVAAGSPPSEAEDTQDLYGRRLDGADRAVWRYSPPPYGYMSQGGYVAVMSMFDVNNGSSFVHLLDYGAREVKDEAVGICAGLRRSTSLTTDEFFRQPFFDDDFASLVLEFTTYNANMQGLTKVAVKFEATFAGLIVGRTITCDTIRLDVFHPTMRFLELAYLVVTCVYFLEFALRFLKKYNIMIWELFTWVNLVGLVMSIVSLAVWYSYIPNLEAFVKTSDFMKPSLVGDFYGWTHIYKQTSAIAAMTLWLRLLEFLSGWRSRCRLLSSTLRMGAASIVIYLSYIFVIFAGFCAFAQNYFSTYSDEFTTPLNTFLSCFRLFFGQVDALAGVDQDSATLAVPFYVLFMVFFYFVSVQMFNAIINYSYNRVSEQMEAQFETERRINAKKTSVFGFLSKLLRGRAGGALAKAGGSAGGAGKASSSHLGHLGKDRMDGAAKGQAAPRQAGAMKSVMASAQFESLAEQEKAKVEAFLNKDDVKKDPDSAGRMVLVTIFVACYLAFLTLNLSVTDNFQLSSVIDKTVKRDTGARVWEGMVTLPQAAQWMEDVLPRMIFNSTPPQAWARAVAQGVVNESSVCIKGWNCLVTMEEKGFSGVKALRVTQRRANSLVNDGARFADTPDEQKFTGGPHLGASIAEVMVPFRSPGGAIYPSDPPDGEFENITGLFVPATLADFCQVPGAGTPKSYMEHGGLVCLLDADYATFMNQLGRMRDAAFFSPETSSWVLDFAMQNSNRQLLSHAHVAFTVLPSGELQRHIEVQSVKLFSLRNWYDNFEQIVWRLAPGVVYFALTFHFVWLLWDGYRKERMRRKHRAGENALQALVAYFRYDVFNVLEAVSIGLSIASAINFVAWIAADLRVQVKKEEGFTSFLGFSLGLSQQASGFTRISAANVLLIGARPFKFVRENVRISKMYQSFWGASNDIFWFVIMLFFTMFGFLFLVHLAFGPHVLSCSTPFGALVTCFRYLLGDFDLKPFVSVDPFMSTFMFPYLLLMYCVFTNIFFAIIDRHFIAMEAPPFQWKRKLKPLLARLCRCLEWDEDFVMEQDPNAEKKQGPPSRKDRVKITQMKIQAILSTADSHDAIHGVVARAKDLSDVCDQDERIEEVLAWSRGEARKFVAQFQKLAAKKRSDQLDEHYIQTEVMPTVEQEVAVSEAEVEQAGRFMRYATQVHEVLTKEDQETLAKYITVLERRIQQREMDKQSLNREVERLESDIDKLRNPEDHVKARGDGPAGRSRRPGAAGGPPPPGHAPGSALAAAAGDTAPDADSDSSASSEDRQAKDAGLEAWDDDEASVRDKAPDMGDGDGASAGGSKVTAASELLAVLGAHRSRRERGRSRAK